MAEKEERILIGTDIESPCVKCEVELCTGMCEEYEKFEKEFKPSALKVFSRQEAIDKMCEGWNKLREQINADKEHAHCCSNKMIMEAALNALLEKRND